MLVSLRIQNLALVERLELELAPGLNVLSGETGAGKSVLIEALSLLVGERADTEVVRPGEAEAVVEGLFRLESEELRRGVGAALGEEVSELSLRRELLREGRNRCFVGGRLATAGLLRELGERLLELHGQHEHQRLLRRSSQRDLLDGFGGLDADRSALARSLEAWRSHRRRLDEIRASERARADRERALRDEVADIGSAALDPDRETELRAEAERLRRVEDRLELASAVAGALAGEPGALDLLRSARGALQRLAAEEPLLAGAADRFAAALEDLADLEREVGRYLDGLVRDPARLAELDRREETILRLHRRYATDLSGLLAREAAARAELAAIEGAEGEAAELEREVATERRRLDEAGRALSRGRLLTARRLSAEVRRHLRDLDMGEGTFEVRLEPVAELESGGFERAEFLIAPNPGEPAAPLRAIASGGELSRVTLALKSALARVDPVPTLVFDEVDAGIGGRVAGRVAEKLVEIAATRQVLAVTHLAPIAARADLHLRVEKSVRDGRSHTQAAPLAGDERVEELSRMLGAEPGSETSRRYARELLLSAASAGVGRAFAARWGGRAARSRGESRAARECGRPRARPRRAAGGALSQTPASLREARILTPPNALSLVRLLLLPPTLLALEHQDSAGSLPAVLLLSCALGSDALDGLLARGRGWVSSWGRVLDPLADKLYIGGVVLYLALERDFPLWLLAVVLARDLFLMIASALLIRRHAVVFGPNLWGKTSTVLLAILLFAYVLRVDAVKTPLIVAIVATLLLSLVGYVRNAWGFLRMGAARTA